MKTINFFLATVMVIGLVSCLRLDDNLFNQDNSIASYLWDEYRGEVDFVLDESYAIPSNRIHLFTLQSQGADESTPTAISALYLGDLDRIATDTVILYCHGNRDHMDFYWQRAKLLANAGGKNRFGVLMLDYRGFGLSQGKPTEAGMYADVNAGLKWLQQNGLTNERLIAYGFSLGSAPATEISAYPENYVLNPSKLILEAPFASSSVMVQDASLLSLPSSYFTNVKVNNADKIKNVQQPFLWLHGTDDGFLNIKTHGEVVFKNHGGNQSWPIRVQGADHGDVPEKMGFEAYNAALVQFITGF